MKKFLSIYFIRLFCFSLLLLASFAGSLVSYYELAHLTRSVDLSMERSGPFFSGIISLQEFASDLDLQLHSQLKGEIVDNFAAIKSIERLITRAGELLTSEAVQVKDREYLATFIVELKRLKISLQFYKKNKQYDATSSYAEELYEIIDESVVSLNLNLSKIISLIQKEKLSSDEKIKNDIKKFKTILIANILGMLFTIIIIFYFFNWSLTWNLAQILKGTKRVGDGDFTYRIDNQSKDEFGKLSVAFDSMAERLAGSQKELTENTQRIMDLAYYDSLTGLPNRITFINQLEHSLERAKRYQETLGVLFIDLDDFKDVNDSFGHEAGDLLLQEVARRLKKCTRKVDTIARMGGDEFTIIITQQKKKEDATVVCQRIHGELGRPFEVSERIVQELSSPFKIDGHEVVVSSSIGIAIYPENGLSSKEMLNSADTAMYAAKNQGKNSYKFCTEEMSKEVSIILETEQDLRRALVNDEFILYYQPQYDLTTDALTGLEALIRWYHPEKGLIQPNDFIHIAESRGLIHDLTKWVIKRVCKQIRLWLDEGLEPVKVMVNITARDLFQKGIEPFIKSALEGEQLPSKTLGVEVTESSVIEEKEDAIKALNILTEFGVSVALDDFGTGYSSLSYLSMLPIEIVKIDRSFLRNVLIDKKNAAITEAIISMSHALDLSVLAEGVETEAQRDYLRSIGCDRVQGFLYGKPLPVEEVTKLLPKANSTG